MTALSNKTIRELGIITPCEPAARTESGLSYGLSVCSYDVRSAEDFHLGIGFSYLIPTIEHFTMPDDVVGIVHPKSTYARDGVITQSVVLDPGWRGHLTVAMWNPERLSCVAAKPVMIMAGDPIAQVVFHRLDQLPDGTYDGKYQDQGPEAQGPL